MIMETNSGTVVMIIIILFLIMIFVAFIYNATKRRPKAVIHTGSGEETPRCYTYDVVPKMGANENAIVIVDCSGDTVAIEVDERMQICARQITYAHGVDVEKILDYCIKN